MASIQLKIIKNAKRQYNLFHNQKRDKSHLIKSLGNDRDNETSRWAIINYPKLRENQEHNEHKCYFFKK